MTGHTSPGSRRPRRVNPYPFILVILVLFFILFFVAYPVQRIFMRGQLHSTFRNTPFPPSGTVGYLKADEGFIIFASLDLNTLLHWEKQTRDPVRQRHARSLLENGQIIVLPKNTLAMSVTPLNGGVQILSGPLFGKTIYIWADHVHFITLHAS
ncbi:MAG: hypothetical protein ACYC9S_07730 [Leptospirales bacterium]